MTIQWVSSGPCGVLIAACASSGRRTPTTRPPVKAALLIRKSRRSVRMEVVMSASSRGFRGEMDRIAHTRVCPAAADVGHGGIDVGIARVLVLLEQRGGGHDH